MIFDPQIFTVSESMGSLSPGVLLSRPSPVSFNLIIDLVDVNTTGNVSDKLVDVCLADLAGADYTPQTVTVPVASNSPESLSFDITVNNDDIVECTEVFNLVISPTSWCGVDSGNIAQVTIINNDGKEIMKCALLTDCCVFSGSS